MRRSTPETLLRTEVLRVVRRIRKLSRSDRREARRNRKNVSIFSLYTSAADAYEQAARMIEEVVGDP